MAVDSKACLEALLEAGADVFIQVYIFIIVNSLI